MVQGELDTVIFGCGNILMGDDGFGPVVVDKLNSQYTLPDSAAAIDVGTGVREYLLDYLLMEDGRPGEIIVLDAVDFTDKKPGELFFIDVNTIPEKKIHDFSLHQFPTVNLLRELEKHTGIGVKILVAQVESVPDEIAVGLSATMRNAVDRGCHTVLQLCREQER